MNEIIYFLMITLLSVPSLSLFILYQVNKMKRSLFLKGLVRVKDFKTWKIGLIDNLFFLVFVSSFSYHLYNGESWFNTLMFTSTSWGIATYFKNKLLNN